MNILFVGGRGSNPDANSVCVNNMAREMISRGHKVWILGIGDKYVRDPGIMDGAELWQIPDTYYSCLVDHMEVKRSFLMLFWFKLVSLLRHILIFPFYPNAAPFRSLKVAQKAKQLVRNNDIKLVVAIFNRYENIYAGMQIKKKWDKDVRVVSYHLDLRTASTNPSASVRNYIYKHALSSIVKENQVVDRMLIPYSGRKNIEQMEGVNLNKISFVGFPVFRDSKEKIIKCDLPFEYDTINICYIGSLSVDNRNPEYTLSLLEKASEQLGRKLMVHFWGGIGGMDALLETSSVAIYHGMVENRYVRYIMDSSDFLLNIGNAIAYEMLPSKVFGMFATGKPIINVIGHPQDATLPFFECYNNSIEICEYEHDIENDAKRLAEGVMAKLTVPKRETEGIFDDFKPERICDIILEIL